MKAILYLLILLSFKIVNAYASFPVICTQACSMPASYGKSCANISLPTIPAQGVCAGSPYCYILNYINITPSTCTDEKNNITLDVKKSNIVTTYNSNNQSQFIRSVINNGQRVNVATAFAGSDIAIDPVMSGVEIWVDSPPNNNNIICLYTSTAYGPQALVCKSAPPSYRPIPNSVLTQCTNASSSCYDADSNHSRSIFNFSGVAYQCLTETLERTFYLNTPSCPNDYGVNQNIVNIFVNFQNKMRNTVSAAIVLYVIFFAIKILLGEIRPKLSTAAMFIMKIILVFYFSVGLGPMNYINGNPSQNNGVVTWILPLFKSASMNLASIVFNAGNTKELCLFNASSYSSGRGYYSIWDSIDCRIAHYFGLGGVWNVSPKLDQYPYTTKIPPNVTPLGRLPDNKSRHTPSVFSNADVFLFFALISGLINGGFIILVLFSSVSFLIFVSILLGTISSILVCIVTFYAIVYLSPIFVPMSLFNHTKGYFDAWVRILISLTLQPLVLLGFLSFMLLIMDSFIFNGCSFITNTYTIPSYSGMMTREFDFFRLGYTGDSSVCKASPGFAFYKYYTGKGWFSISLLLFSFSALLKPVELQSAMFLLFFISIILYYFSTIVVDLASELTSGPNVKSVSISAGAFANFVVNVTVFIAKAIATKGQSVKDEIKKKAKETIQTAREKIGLKDKD